jgi:hypothetical protein
METTSKLRIPMIKFSMKKTWNSTKVQKESPRLYTLSTYYCKLDGISIEKESSKMRR